MTSTYLITGLVLASGVVLFWRAFCWRPTPKLTAQEQLTMARLKRVLRDPEVAAEWRGPDQSVMDESMADFEAGRWQTARKIHNELSEKHDAANLWNKNEQN